MTWSGRCSMPNLYRLMMLCAFLATTPLSQISLAQSAEDLVGTWEGHYYCAAGRTLATVHIRNQGGGLGGLFSFRPMPGGRGLSGSYEFTVSVRGEEVR